MIHPKFSVQNQSSLKNECYNNEINDLNFISEIQRESFLKLPLTVRAWAYFEQAKNPKAYDPDFYPKPSGTTLPSNFMPESRSILQLEAWRVSNQVLEGMTSNNNIFPQRFNNNDGSHTILIHPSLSNQQLLMSIGAINSKNIYYFIPLASPRTGITWKLGEESLPFISKMSIKPSPDQENTLVRGKNDLGVEAMMSVVKTTCVQSRFSDNGSYLFDQYCLGLKQEYGRYTQGLGTYGVLYRSIPDYVTNNNITYIPFFALSSSGNKSLLVSLIEKSGLTIEQYFDQYIYSAVAKFIINNSKAGIYADHLHGQNLLIKAKVNPQELNSLEQLIAEVVYRDIADLKISRDAETSLCTNFRQQQGGRECLYTPGSYIYEAASQFLICSAFPIIDAIVKAQKNGDLAPAQYGTAEVNSLCLMFMKKVLQTMSSELSSVNQEAKQHFYNCVYEFASMANVANNLFKNSPRARPWQNTIMIMSRELYNQIQNYGHIEQSRQSKLLEYIQDYLQDSTMRYTALDQSRRQLPSNPAPLQSMHQQPVTSIYTTYAPWLPQYSTNGLVQNAMFCPTLQSMRI